MIDKLKSIKEFKDYLNSMNKNRYRIYIDNVLVEIYSKENCYIILCNYIDFMYKTLELGMFVPCLDGVPLEKPEDYDKWLLCNLQGLELYFSNEKECLEYQEAENKVLFKGFEMVRFWRVDRIQALKLCSYD